MELSDCVVLTHPIHLHRLTLRADLWRLCGPLLSRPLTAAEFAGDSLRPDTAAALFSMLRDRGFVVPEDADELEQAERAVTEGDGRARYLELDPVGPGDLTPGPGVTGQAGTPDGEGGLTPMRVMLVGGCVLQFAEDALVRRGARRGLSVTTRHLWPDDREPLAEQIGAWDPHLIVLQPSTQHFMSPLWDHGALEDEGRRRRQAAALGRLVASHIDDLAAAAGDRLVLVHNFAFPAISPFGRFDFRTPAGFRELVGGLNLRIDAAASAHGNVMVLDEQALAARHGAGRLFDDLYFPYGHHGGMPDLTVEQPNQTPGLSSLLAEEYLDCHVAHHRLGQIKCVVTDLDGTLWPGNAAETGFGWVDSDGTSRWLHMGVQQALALLGRRGILLATCGKGSAEVTLDLWRRNQGRLMISPDDFVTHRINWEDKSANILRICRDLQVAPESVLFLDDNHVERLEVRARAPGVRVLDVPVHDFRRALLSDPRCQTGSVTKESALRAVTTKAMLAREELASATDRRSFLRDLEVTMTVRPAVPADLPRVVELCGRTTQFNTMGSTLTGEEARASAATSAVWTLSVSDRIADYGLVGVVMLRGAEVAGMVVSCRVLGLDVALPFLVATLRAGGGDRPGTTGSIVETARNHPCRGIFTSAGFEPAGAGLFRLADPGRLPSLDDLPHRLDVQAGTAARVQEAAGA
ncbi:HAD-IIIC family phosphatase [Sphaerisporangium album]|uniref:HAD-IIIC family phosphatase n=1 Tax=Sphaerisporangium album TaxID=509200 RepID=UPI0011C03258|nr:HAD-IIIC family phosphatase [Sphaerisporangium album]